MGIDPALAVTVPIEELDTPADVLAQNDEFETVASDGEAEETYDPVTNTTSTTTESFIDFSEIDPFSDGNF